MAGDLDFNAKEFLELDVDDRARRCRLLAQRAQELAESADPNFRNAYLEIAKQWLLLAQNMEREPARKPEA